MWWSHAVNVLCLFANLFQALYGTAATLDNDCFYSAPFQPQHKNLIGKCSKQITAIMHLFLKA